MKDCHSAWLLAHPHRTVEWLNEKLIDCFDVHHIDGDKNNSSYENLVLIECSDHMMLHGGKRIVRVSHKDRKYTDEQKEDAKTRAANRKRKREIKVFVMAEKLSAEILRKKQECEVRTDNPVANNVRGVPSVSEFMSSVGCGI